MPQSTLPTDWTSIRATPYKSINFESIDQSNNHYDDFNKYLNRINNVVNKIDNKVEKLENGFNGLKKCDKNLDWIDQLK
ncbi:hypothetical protein BN7_1961 [Wickerhamomyces ciferrii]|uniref:Uncharacterized protein n=1 Tax=Wickerhamomyces ciferrii (strain ATCC 14091 / BCRC 22168 / CBS 111 / JCM 3599 / NBRC 0793 / NRRL Y-1031 F-60-10) TaxID=1206466 RepID=K0KHD2_WICCF|nr:uncharacterized protein BN7_1961 [Wickerhamomyces ciferrii]CCH42416.1 hypothetical protein BN7_1961 [Wickerhamomyces ciferrii]